MKTLEQVPTMETPTEMRARKYAHTVTRNDSARRAYADAVAVLGIAVAVLGIAVAVLVASYVSGVASFAFGTFGREVARGASWVLSTGSAVLVAVCVQDARATRTNYRQARTARAKACAELLSSF